MKRNQQFLLRYLMHCSSQQQIDDKAIQCLSDHRRYIFWKIKNLIILDIKELSNQFMIILIIISLIMFDDMFDTPDELLSGQKEGNLQSFWGRLPKNCADGLPLPEIPRKKGYPIGLKNQASTCYLNSLLQVLYHTPELRRIILSLPLCKETVNEPTDFVSQKKHNFLMGFQQLFSEMTLSDQRAVSTEFITKAFGWEKAEHLQQQDIQQAMRIIFDTMERALFGTGQDQQIRSLFKGTTIRYKSCTCCGEIKEHSEDFFDLLLQVHGPKSVDDSVMLLTTAESMSGQNQIDCQICQSKQDMWLGTRLQQLPGTLVLSLNRFEFDYQKMDRVKINSFFQFKLEQDFSKYLMPHSDPDYYKYQLYGVVIHRGTAQGGHYICYVRDLLQESDWNTGLTETLKRKASEAQSKATVQPSEKQKQGSKKQQQKQYELKEPQNKKLLENWFEINDNIATAISANQITTKYEGSGSAYILFYRRKSLTTGFIDLKVPQYFAKTIAEANEVKQKERELYDIQKQHIIININEVNHKLKTCMPLQSFMETFIPEGSALVLESVHNGLPYYPMQIIHHSSQTYAPETTLQSMEIYHESRWKTYQLGTPEYQLIKSCIGKQRLPFELVLLYDETPKRIVCYQDQNFLMLRIKIENILNLPYEKQILTLVTPYKQIILTDKLENDDVLLPKLGVTHGGQIIIRSMDLEEDVEKNQELVKETTLLCFLIERDDVIGLKRIYFEKTKTLRELLTYFCASESLPETKHRFRNLNGNRLYYQQHYDKPLIDLELNEEMIKLRVERGQVPIKGDISLKFKLQSQLYKPEEDKKEAASLEKIFDPNTVLTEVKQLACEFYHLEPAKHKLYMTDWLGEPVRSLNREKLTLFELNFGREEIVCIRDINSPIGAELVHLQIFTTKTGAPDSIEKESVHLNIEEYKTVGDLKQLIIATVPELSGVSSDRLRLREIKRDYMFGTVWRENGKSVKSVTINSNKVVLQVLQSAEKLTEEQIVLVVKRRNKATRTYGQTLELIFDAGKAPTVQDLVAAVKKRVDCAEDIKIAKYVYYNFEWMEVSRQNIESVVKGKKSGQKGQNKNKGAKNNKKEEEKKPKQQKEKPKQQKEKVKVENAQKGQAKEKNKGDDAKTNEQKNKKEKKGKADTVSKTLEDCQNLRKAPVLLKDGDWIGWGPALELLDDDLQTDEDLSLRLMKDSKPATYKGKEAGGFKLNVQF